MPRRKRRLTDDHTSGPQMMLPVAVTADSVNDLEVDATGAIAGCRSSYRLLSCFALCPFLFGTN
jgi:hypothetical protein